MGNLKKESKCSPIHVGSGGSFSIMGGFTVASTYFRLRLHFDIISSLLFKVVSGFAIKIINFSVRLCYVPNIEICIDNFYKFLNSTFDNHGLIEPFP